MLFNSYEFILFFLPCTLILYYLFLGRGWVKAAKVLLVGLSLYFYAYFRLDYVWILMGSILGNYVLSRFLGGSREKISGRILLGIGIAGNTAVIFFYKYFDFFLENLNRLFQGNLSLMGILMPLGISFFTIQQIAYLVDSYRGHTREDSFLDYALFVAFFPQLVAGPIVNREEMMPQFAAMGQFKYNSDHMAEGLYLFAIGLFKKVVLADTLGRGADWGYAAVGSLSGMDTVLVVLLYTFQLYFDFSGYCDMACGIASMFRLRLPANFNSPYQAVSIADFWKRWHMSLTRFLTNYIYIPLGGNRCGKLRCYGNILLVFLISGIWHGANWTYVVWGLLHGVAQVLYRIFQKPWDRMPKPLAWAATFSFWAFSLTAFRAANLKDTFILWQNVFCWKQGGISSGLAQSFQVIEFTYLEDHIPVLRQLITILPSLHIWILLMAGFGIVLCGKNAREGTFHPTAINAAGSILLLLWSIVSLSGLSTFLYFNF